MHGNSSERGARRVFLQAAASVVLVGCAPGRAAKREEGERNEGEAEVTPGEDLMQEHGVLERILLIYDEGARRIDAGEPLDVAVVGRAAEIVRRFIEQYHEQNEERFVFPRMREANREVELVGVLLEQHRRGREVTDAIVRQAGAGGGAELAPAMRSFVRMYRPHAAREETVLFPAFREVVGREGYRELGEQFEEDEHRRFGENGFQHFVTQVAELEQALGIFDLAQFTPEATR